MTKKPIPAGHTTFHLNGHDVIIPKHSKGFRMNPDGHIWMGGVHYATVTKSGVTYDNEPVDLPDEGTDNSIVIE